jgi:hypothetical protein
MRHVCRNDSFFPEYSSYRKNLNLDFWKAYLRKVGAMSFDEMKSKDVRGMVNCMNDEIREYIRHVYPNCVGERKFRAVRRFSPLNNASEVPYDTWGHLRLNANGSISLLWTNYFGHRCEGMVYSPTCGDLTPQLELVKKKKVYKDYALNVLAEELGCRKEDIELIW